MKKDFLSIADLLAQEIWEVLLLAKKFKNQLNKQNQNNLNLNKQMVMLFEKPSLRTKLSFDIAMSQLGGHAAYFSGQEVGMNTRESVSDIAKVISSMADILVARVYNHTLLENLAQNASIPVINALSDKEHPCQILADLFTIWEVKGKLKGLALAYLGDGKNNICSSLAIGCARMGIHFKCASPKEFSMSPGMFKTAKNLAGLNNSQIIQTEFPIEAVKNADVIYTDTWVSMGNEEEKQHRLKIFKPFQVAKLLMNEAKNDVIFMHDMPAYRGYEVTGEVIDGSNSVVYQQAENRLHAQKALIYWLIS